MSPPHPYRGGGRAVPGTAPPPADHRIPRFQSTTEKLRLVAAKGADYVFVVKDNEPDLKEALGALD